MMSKWKIYLSKHMSGLWSERMEVQSSGSGLRNHMMQRPNFWRYGDFFLVIVIWDLHEREEKPLFQSFSIPILLLIIFFNLLPFCPIEVQSSNIPSLSSSYYASYWYKNSCWYGYFVYIPWSFCWHHFTIGIVVVWEIFSVNCLDLWKGAFPLSLSLLWA